jgi:hypothetical protein
VGHALLTCAPAIATGLMIAREMVVSATRNRFKRQKTLYKLNFEGRPEVEGLEVTASSLPLGEFLALQRLQERTQQDATAAEQLIKRFASVIEDWNLDDEDGSPVPPVYAQCTVSGQPGEPGLWCPEHASEEEGACEYTGLCSCELGFVLTVFMAWMEAVASVPNHLLPPSNGGGTSLERSIPMEPSSRSPGS